MGMVKDTANFYLNAHGAIHETDGNKALEQMQAILKNNLTSEGGNELNNIDTQKDQIQAFKEKIDKGDVTGARQALQQIIDGSGGSQGMWNDMQSKFQAHCRK